MPKLKFAIPPAYHHEKLINMDWMNFTETTLLDILKAWNVSYFGSFNIPPSLDWTLPVYLAICHLKVLIVKQGISLYDLESPVLDFFSKLYDNLRKLIPNISLPMDKESIISEICDFKVFSVTNFITMVTACNHHVGILVDLHLLAVLCWHVHHLYRENLCKLLFLVCSIFIIYKETSFISAGLSWFDMFFLVTFVYLVLYFALPDKVSFDLALLCGIMLLYLTCSVINSFINHGFVPPKTVQEYKNNSWLVKTSISLSS